MTTTMDEFPRSFLSNPVKRRSRFRNRLEGRTLKELSYVEYNSCIQQQSGSVSVQ